MEKRVHLFAMINDANRFISINRSVIEIAPLQVYYSAIVFSPENSTVRNQFVNQSPKWIKAVSVLDQDWNLSLQILEGRTSGISQIAFSPDSRLLASASHGYTISL